jgi:hypothetical protein
MRKRSIIYSILCILFAIIGGIYTSISGPFEASVGISQLNGTTTDYIISTNILNGLIYKSIYYMIFLFLILFSYEFIISFFKKQKDSDSSNKETQNA